MTSHKTDPIRILYACLVSLLLFMGFAGLPGCSSTPEVSNNSYAAFVTAGEARSSVINTISILNEAGYIDEDDWEDIDAAIELTGIALRLWSEALMNQEPTEEAEQKFYESFRYLKDIRDPALEDSQTPKDKPQT